MATHVGANPPLLDLELKQFRRYEIETKTSPATSAEEIGVKNVSNSALCHILQNLSVLVRLILLVPATTCSPERSFSALCQNFTPTE